MVGSRDSGGAAAPPEGCLKPVADPEYGAGKACSCAADCASGNCFEGKCCEGAGCAPRRPDGAKCSADSDCQSKFCTDGVCCNTACKEACKACNLPLAMGECNDAEEGQPDPHKLCAKEPVTSCGLSGLCDGNGKCAKYQEDTICRPEGCPSITSYAPPGTCDGQGKCITEPNESCDPARCEANKCIITCANDTQCAPGKACVNGVCGEFPEGRTCTKAEDCLSGICVDGVCCLTECDEPCMTCNATNKRGTCSPIAAGVADPMCEAEAATSCGSNGKCNGSGQCAQFDNNTICEAAACDEASNTASGSGKCANGMCGDGTSHSCAPYQGCNGANCRTSCSSNDQCVSGYSCNGGRCTAGGGGGNGDAGARIVTP